MERDAEILVEVSGLVKEFADKGGAVRVVDGVSFTIRRGETLGLVGESGGFVQYLALGFVIPVGYLIGITSVGTVLARGVSAPVRAWVPVVLATMHMCWGLGFLTSPRRLARRR